MTKKSLLTNFSFLAILMIFVILIAPIFIPNEEFVPAVGEEPAKWQSTIIALDDINLIVYFAIVTFFSLLYIIKTIFLVKKQKDNFLKAVKANSRSEKLIILSTVMTFVTSLVFLLAISTTPYVTAHLREHMILAPGENLNVISNPAINQEIYYQILIPVFVAIVPMTYVVGLAIYLEVLKRINEEKQAKKE